MLEKPFSRGGVLNGFSALIGNHHQIAVGLLTHVNPIQNMVEKQFGIPLQGEASFVFLGGDERCLVSIQQNIGIATVDLLANRKAFDTEQMIVVAGRGLLEGCAEGVVEQLGLFPI